MAKTSGPSTAALTKLQETMGKSFGAGVLTPPERVIVPTGSLELDLALGTGGLLLGRVYQTWGTESTAKSTMGLLQAAQHQRMFPDKMIGWVDMEQTFDFDWARAHGLDLSPNRFMIAFPDSAEDVADQVKIMMESDLICHVTLDSIGGMVSRKEFDKDAEEAVVGVIAKAVTRMARIAAVRGRQHGATLHVINQVRANIGSYGGGDLASGGHNLRHTLSANMKNRTTSTTPLTVGSGDRKRIVGREFAIMIQKNKTAPPGGVANVTLLNQPTEEFGAIGLDPVTEAVNVAKRLDLITRSGAWYTTSDGERHNGDTPLKEHLRGNPKLIEGIRTKALATLAPMEVPA